MGGGSIGLRGGAEAGKGASATRELSPRPFSPSIPPLCVSYRVISPFDEYLIPCGPFLSSPRARPGGGFGIVVVVVVVVRLFVRLPLLPVQSNPHPHTHPAILGRHPQGGQNSPGAGIHHPALCAPYRGRDGGAVRSDPTEGGRRRSQQGPHLHVRVRVPG